MKAIVLLLAFILYASAQSAPTFCESLPPGMYCNSAATGYYWCLPQYTSSVLQACPAGTVCECFQGPECSRVPTVGNGSPCGFATTVPGPYATAFTATQTVVASTTLPACTQNSSSSNTVYVNGVNERVDSTIYTDSTCGDSGTTTHTQTYYTANSDGTVTEHVYSVEAGTCSSSSFTGPLPNIGVPAGYEYYGSDSINGVAVSVYYFMQGLSMPSELYGMTNYIYVTSSNVPVEEMRVDYAFRVNTRTNTYWNSFTSGAPTASFTLPAAC